MSPSAPQEWQALIEPSALEKWMDNRGLGAGAIEETALLGGGTQNILLRFRRSDQTYVLRRPPLHKRADSDEIMRREARLLTALRGSAVPHPELIAAEPSLEPLGAAFYLMEPVEGFNPSIGLPGFYADRADWRRKMGDALIDALVALASIDYVCAGLGDFGRCEGWLERQVGRWRRQLDSYTEHADWPGSTGLPPIERICAWLEARRPQRFQPGLLHGDYHLANVLFHHDRPEIAAVVDWELASLGDPLLDLGWLTASWPDGEFEAIFPVRPWAGFPAVAELVERYCAATGRSLVDALWFEVLACFKLAVLLEGTHARACARLAPREIGDRLHAQAIALLRRASGRIQ